MGKLKLVALKLWVRVMFLIWGPWSRLNQWLREWRYKHIIIKPAERYEDAISSNLRLIAGPYKWRKWRPIPSASKMEFKATWATDRRVDDSRDTTLHLAAKLNAGLRTGKFIGDMDLDWTFLLTVTWLTPWGDFEAVTLPLLALDHEYNHAYSTMLRDGTQLEPRMKTRDLAKDILDRSASGNSTCLGYAVHTVDMKHCVVYW